MRAKVAIQMPDVEAPLAARGIASGGGGGRGTQVEPGQGAKYALEEEEEPAAVQEEVVPAKVEQSEEEVLALLAALDPRDFIDVEVPLESAVYTSVAWKAVAAKPATQAFLVLLGVGMAALSFYINSNEKCLGWDGIHHPEYVWTSSWDMWSGRVFPFASSPLHFACGTLYCVWHRDLAGATLRHGMRRPCMVFAAWYLVSVLVMAIKMYAIGMTKDEQERSCLVRGNASDLRFEGEKFMIERVQRAVASFVFVAVTYTGKRGLVACLWFFAVFGLPLAVLARGDPGWSIFVLLLFLPSAYILVKRHYLLKRTTAGLLKDRKT